ncbi:MAG: hypothetical protein HYY25_17325 [Candidatus Wallbacteria bacterium]|nr:hypothetical protein [Candidatus Wallbacteria bacterium]
MPCTCPVASTAASAPTSATDTGGVNQEGAVGASAALELPSTTVLSTGSAEPGTVSEAF